MTVREEAVPLLGGAESDLAGLEPFVTEHYPRLVGLAGLITRDVDEAQDAVQTALERAWRARSSLDDPARLRPWLDRIVVREAIRTWRWRLVPRWLRLSSEVREIELSKSDKPAERTTSEMVALRVAYEHLSPAHRAVIALHLHAGYSVAETARLLGIPHDTVRSRLRVARDHLRREMAEEPA